ncbi:hypothetical protein PH5382_02495 [Phaeobacter sp. CECT 5382]|uniref:glutathione S-transferase n=1 Tax=Phaeobacter sp. CECT 5382 TaxID=1712645 RepID=UPI0006DA6641|nr:glutathione S-transferase [Phaeobacter sp. CECT 5382]CUH88559.1 hypothetical protein PH5382_02495 [Phaeobacter sp. CECT 5382]
MRPILYSFRRCPYAMRARLALVSAGLSVELREVVLRDKPAAFLQASQSGTVPCLTYQDKAHNKAIDESLDIMIWALQQKDPENWLAMPEHGWEWIARADGPFKTALDRTKYANRYPEADPVQQRELAGEFLADLNEQIGHWIFTTPSIADFAILPFVRQFAFIDKPWFDQQPWPDLQAWLNRFLTSHTFERIMPKYPQWCPDQPAVLFPSQTGAEPPLS